MYDAVYAEKLNKPTTVLSNVGFANDSYSAASGKGVPGLRIVVEKVPCECTVPEVIEAGTGAAIDEIIAALTRPRTVEEESPQPREAEVPGRVVFKGDVQEVNTFFYKRGWTDGLPIVPPTEAAICEMLKGTDLPPDHVVARMIPRGGKATVEKIAINAVMAGALPTHLPVLIAGVQALMDPTAWFGTWEVSTGSWVPFYIVNGPIRHQLHVNSGAGALSPGDIANAAIGRAMSLIVKNIGGARKGIEDMGVLGNPGKYTMVIAENEEESPWEPLHVERGFGREDNCISVTFPNQFPQNMPFGTDEKGILRGIISNIMPAHRALTLVIIPGHAKTLGEAGWTKRELLEYVAEYARVPAYRHPSYWEQRGRPLAAGRRQFSGAVFNPTMPPLNPEDPTRTLDANYCRLVVAGGPGNFMGFFGGSGTSVCVTKKIDLPAKWESLVAKYKDVVPNHVRY